MKIRGYYCWVPIRPYSDFGPKHEHRQTRVMKDNSSVCTGFPEPLMSSPWGPTLKSDGS